MSKSENNKIVFNVSDELLARLADNFHTEHDASKVSAALRLEFYKNFGIERPLSLREERLKQQIAKLQQELAESRSK